MRLTTVLAVLCLGICSVFADTQAEHPLRRPVNIAPQQLAQALQILASDRDVQLVYRSELVGDRRTPGVDGLFTFDEALTRLLAGSGLRYSYLDNNAVTLVREEGSQ